MGTVITAGGLRAPDPRARDPARVEADVADVADGLVSPRQAREAYGADL